MRTSAAEHARTEQIARDDEGRSSPLVRVMGRRDLTAAVVNAVIGSGVFGLPAGFHVGWLLVWTRLLSAGAVLNVLVA